MTLQQHSSLAPHKAVDRPAANISHSQKKLQRLTKAAVDRAYKLHTEARRLVHIVETERCGSSKQLGLSNPFSSFLFSVLLKNSASKLPSSARNWALSKESSDRRSVTARVQTLLMQWRADSSRKWRARVASVVPVLEEALYKEAKSREEYTNPELLESRLLHVLCQFEAGNGPFLLQGSTGPLYPLRNWYPPCSPSDTMSPLCPYASRQGAAADDGSDDITSEETYERARLSCAESSASGSSPNPTDVPVHLGQSISKEGSSRGHAGKKFVRKVANMLAKKRMEDGEPGRRANQEDAEKVEKVSVNAEMEGAGRADTDRDSMSCDESLYNGDERRKRTLGGMLGLAMFENSRVTNAEEAPLAFSTTNETVSESTPLFHAEEAPLSLRTPDDTSASLFPAEEAPLSLCTPNDTSQDMMYNLVADAMEHSCIPDSQAEEAVTLSLSSTFLAGLQVVDNEASYVSTTATEVLLESTETGEFSQHGANCAFRSLPHSCYSFSSSASTPSSAAAAAFMSHPASSSASLPFVAHPAPLSSPSLTHPVLPSPSSSPSLTHAALSSPSSSSPLSSSSPSPSLAHPALSSSSPSPSLLSSSSPSPSQQQLAHRSTPWLTPLPQHQSPSFSRRHHALVPLLTLSDMSSVELNHAWRLENQNRVSDDGNEMNVLPRLRTMASCGATESTTQVAFGEPTTQAASEQPTEGERRASSSTSSLSASGKVLSRTRERGVKVPLRSFLADREGDKGCESRYEEEGPWETWEEVTEQLDGMCCVCMVGFKGAAFIPCGHTFCRKCCRELWRGRGTCPLCNRYIREILDIY